MTWVQHLSGYGLAYAVVAYLIPFIQLVIGYVIFLLNPKNKKWATTSIFLSSLLATVGGLMLFEWICNLLDIQIRIAMLAIPLLLSIRISFDRIRIAEIGASATHFQMLESGQGDEYDPKLDARNEYAYLISELLGFVIASSYCLSINGWL